MSKILKISKHKLDLAQVELTSPSLLIGRSPLCDQVLRAPGVKTVHFLLEWIGEGEFNPSEGFWTLFDMGDLVSFLDEKTTEDLNSSELNVEGIVLNNDQKYFGLNWEIGEDRLKATTIKRGIISNQLMTSSNAKSFVEKNKLALEVVSLDRKEQKVKEVWHFFDQDVTHNQHDTQIPFAIEWEKKDQVKLSFSEKPLAIFNLKGQKINFEDGLELLPQETFVIHFSDDVIFIRFVNRVEFSNVGQSFLINKFFVVVFVSFLAFSYLLYSLKNSTIELAQKETEPPQRVVKIVEKVIPVEDKKVPIVEEKKEIEKEVVKTPEPEPLKEEVVPEPVKEAKVEPPKENKPAPKPKPKSNIAKTKPIPKPKVTDITAIGLLGKLKTDGATINQVSTEAISQNFVNNSTRSNSNKGTFVQTSQVGIVSNRSNPLKSETDANENILTSAETSLKGAKEFSSEGAGPMAKTEGISDGHKLGNGTGKGVKGGTGKFNLNSSNEGGEISGGLSKTQVYAIINDHRREIRTCYESALLVRNDLNGILRLSFVINVAGSVTDVKIVDNELKSTILESCIVQVIRQMKFPESTNQFPTTVIYPFVFRRSS